MSFQVYFHNCPQELQDEVNIVIQNFENNDFELKVKSSGSTGLPKEISHDKKSIITSSRRTNQFFQLNENSKVLCPLAIHTIGAKMSLFRALTGDYELHFVNASRAFINEIPEGMKFDLVSLAVIQFGNLLDYHPNALDRFKNILIGGSAISEQMEQKSIELHLSTFIGFGMTETLSHIALRKLGEPFYKCLEKITVNTIDGGMEIHDNNKTITSTDIIESIDNQNFKWIGRTDFVINSGGVKIIPELIENYISSTFKIKILIIGVPDVTYGEKAILVSEEIIDDKLKTEIKNVIESKFGKYHVPKDFLVLDFKYINELKLDRLNIIKSVKALYE